MKRADVNLVSIMSEGRLPRLMTVAQLAFVAGVSKPAILRRLREIRASGRKLQTALVREGCRGCESVAYALVQKGKR